jgi:uncharacterized UBP type Zn finger protein
MDAERALGHALRAERHVGGGNVRAARLHYGRVAHYARQARESGGALSVVHRAETVARNVARAIKETVEREVTAERLRAIAGLVVVGVTGALIVNSMTGPELLENAESGPMGHPRRQVPSLDEGIPGNPAYARPGLWNLGNTCFMNAVIQCIVSVPVLNSLFTSDSPDCLALSCTSKVALAFVSLVREMDSSARPIKPTMLLGETRGRAWDLWNKAEPGTRAAIREELTKEGLTGANLEMKLEAAMGKRRPDLTKVDAQSDPHEFLTFLLDELACTRVAALITSKKELAFVCSCGASGDPTFESFPIIQLDIPNNDSQASLAQCVAEYNRTEQVDGYKCGHCHKKGTAERNHAFVTSPEVLVIHLERFSFDVEAQTARKVDTSVAFEKELTVGGVQYALTGFVSHMGTSANSGHYTAVCSADGLWYTFDDPVVKGRDSDFEDHYTGAYLLFFEKKIAK